MGKNIDTVNMTSYVPSVSSRANWIAQRNGRQYTTIKTYIFRQHGKAGRDCTQDVVTL
jgi:hypothetical protein